MVEEVLIGYYTTKYFRSTIELTITVRNDHARNMSKIGGGLPAPPCLGYT